MDQQLTITFTAEAAYGHTGAYVARITGRAPRVTFTREFIGRKDGRYSEAIVEDPMLLEQQDVDHKGRKSRDYWLILMVPELGGLRGAQIDAAEAQRIAKSLDRGIALEAIAHLEAGEGTKRNGMPYVRMAWGPAPEQTAIETISASIDHAEAIELGIPETALGAFRRTHTELSALTPAERTLVLRRLNEAFRTEEL
jgi:hypothetical protein